MDLYRRIIEAVRTIDPYHLVFLEGGGIASSDFSIFDKPLDTNQAYSFHTYNLFSNDVGKAYIEGLAEMARTQDVPLWNGEFGAHTVEWVSAEIEFFENPAYNVSGWIFWPWKRVPESGWARNRFRTLMEIESSEDWDTVRKHLASIFGWEKISKDVARRALADFLEASKAENLVVDERRATALLSRRRRTEVHDPTSRYPTPNTSQ